MLCHVALCLCSVVTCISETWLPEVELVFENDWIGLHPEFEIFKFYFDICFPGVYEFVQVWAWGLFYQLVSKGLIKPKLRVLTNPC